MSGPGRRIDKRRFNRAHERIRNRVENVVRYVKRHQLFAQGRAFTHSVEELATVMKIVGHVSALELRRFQRFRSFGPWPHYIIRFLFFMLLRRERRRTASSGF